MLVPFPLCGQKTRALVVIICGIASQDLHLAALHGQNPSASLHPDRLTACR